MGRKAGLAMLAACAALLCATAAQGQEKLEIFSWWSGDEGAGLRALVQRFDALYPDVAVTNASAAVDPGVDPRTVLRTRLLAGDPPDSFQTRGGQNLIDTWVIANRIEDLKGFYRTQGWSSAFPRELIELLSARTGIWSVPLAVNRCNVMWYVPSRLSAWGVNPPRTWGELMSACQKLKDAGVDAPLAVGDASGLSRLWDSVAVATLGPDLWSALWSRRLAFTDPRALRVWDNFGKALDFINSDAAGLSWQQAMDRVARGDSAFTIMGDWAEGYLAGALKLTPGTDFDWVPSPGTRGVFVVRTDAFVLPRGARNRISAFKWLLTIGTRDAQDLFNRLNGSLSPRYDSDLGAYNAYFQSAAKEWRESRIVGSMADGVVAPQSFVGQFAEVIGIYLATRSSPAAGSAAEAIADQVRLGK
jgi:glucose/mannose transport system substrate-binding protein